MADGSDSFGPRLSFQENMELTWLPGSGNSPQRLVSTMPAWKPGKGLPWAEIDAASGRNRNRDPSKPRTFGPGAFGGHVYAQAPFAAAKVVEKADRETPVGNKLGLHVSLRSELATTRKIGCLGQSC